MRIAVERAGHLCSTTHRFGKTTKRWIQANTKPLSQAKAASTIKLDDILMLIAVFLITTSGYHVYTMLTLGDQSFWSIVVLIFLAALAQYYFWSQFRLPIGATFVCLALLTGEWINRYFTFYPITLVPPMSLIPMALYLDMVLLVSKSFVVTAIVGGIGFLLLFYPSNWVILAPYHQLTEQYGVLLTLADVMDLHYGRTSTPEYLQIVDRSNMRFFQDVVGAAAFFAGFVSIIVYLISWYVGKILSYSTEKISNQLKSS